MKENPLKPSQYKVNFRYTNSPTRKDALPDPNSLTNRQQHPSKPSNNEFSSSKTSQSAIRTQQTLKKEGHLLEAVTQRKYARKIDAPEGSDETDLPLAEAGTPHTATSVSQTAMLKEEIKFMRRVLIETQNSEKALRLQFELFRANTEMKRQKQQQQQTICVKDQKSTQNALYAEIQQLKARLLEKQEVIQRQGREKAELSTLLLEQTQRSALLEKESKQKQQQNKQLTIQTRQMYNEIQMRCSDLNALNQDLIALHQDNQHLFNQNNFMKDLLRQKKEENALHLQTEVASWTDRAEQFHSQMVAQAKEIAQMKLRIVEIGKEKEQLDQKYRIQLETIKQAHQQQLKKVQKEAEATAKPVKDKQEDQQISFTPIQANPLTTAELQRHISLLKNQPQHLTAQEFFQLRQQNQGLKEQIQFMRISHQNQQQQLKQEYEEKMAANNEDYTHQLMIYMKEVDVLMEEMTKLKQQRQAQGQFPTIQEEPEENQENQENQENEQITYDHDKVRRDMKLYGQDCCDIYATPYNSKPPSPSNSKEDTHQFVLNQILDLDSKINNYISNFNRKREAEQQQHLIPVPPPLICDQQL